MAKFKVTVYRELRQSVDVEVVAASFAEARRQAQFEALVIPLDEWTTHITNEDVQLPMGVERLD